MAYFEPRIYRDVNASPLMFNIMKFCCKTLGLTYLGQTLNVLFVNSCDALPHKTHITILKRPKYV